MNSMHWHKQFARALTAPDLPLPDGIIRHDGCPDLKRFNVYRNNHVMSLISNLKDGFPLVLAIVGDDFFSYMARLFVEKFPPKSPVMVFYGEPFPAFIRGFEGAEELPYLGDVAELDYLQRLSLHAADIPFLDPDNLPCEAPELFSAQLDFHPSVQFLESEYPVFDIWYANQGHLDHEIRDQAQHIVLLRHNGQVTLILVSEPCMSFLKMLSQGLRLQSAVNKQNAIPSDTLMEWIKVSLTMVTTLRFPEEFPTKRS